MTKYLLDKASDRIRPAALWQEEAAKDGWYSWQEGLIDVKLLFEKDQCIGYEEIESKNRVIFNS